MKWVFLLLLLVVGSYGLSALNAFEGNRELIERVVEQNYGFVKHALPVEGEVRVGKETYTVFVDKGGKLLFYMGTPRAPDFVTDVPEELVELSSDSPILAVQRLNTVRFYGTNLKGKIIKEFVEVELDFEFADFETFEDDPIGKIKNGVAKALGYILGKLG